MIAAWVLIGLGTILLTAGAIYPFGSIHDATMRHVAAGGLVALAGASLIAWGAFL